MRKPNIILIGLPGTSKTTSGKELARQKDMLFLDCDKIFEESFGSISEFFEKCGEAMFRVEEGRILYECSLKENTVISCGGGAVINPAMNYLKQSGTVVLLTASTAEIVKRLSGDASRPLLKGGNPAAKIDALKADRAPLYKKYADVTVSTDGLTPEQIALKIAENV